MRTVNMFEAKSNLSRLVEAVESGAAAEIVIARNGRPVARLVAIKPRRAGPRIGVARCDFDIPPSDPKVDATIADLFEGGKLKVPRKRTKGKK